MAGPTVAGSIVAKLRVDDSAWSAEMAAAGAKADELGRHDPKIRIDVDSAAAIAKMAAVESAEKRVDVANQALRLSYLRLDEAQGKGGVSAARLAALHLAASRAESAHESATKRLAAAQLELAAANETEEVSESRANDTHGMTVSRMGLIIAAIAVLVPMLAPLAGYAVGVAGALAGMGAAGVLAVVGIKQAMDAGNATGQAYSQGLKTLKGDMSALAATSAGAMLGSFQQAVGMINADMPSLNGQISTFSRMLGQVGTTVLGGVLQAFKVLNPLFVQAGQYVQDLAGGFKKWTEDGGLQKFANYAQQSLPQVAQTLGSLASAALQLIEALAPIGSVTLGILKAFGDAINALPDSLLLTIAAGVTAIVVATKAMTVLPPIIDRVKASFTGLGGAIPIGLVVAFANELAILGAQALGGLVNDLTGMSKAFKAVDTAISSGDLGSSHAEQSVARLKSTLANAKGQLGGFAGTLIDVSNKMDASGWGWLAGPTQAFMQSTLGKTSKTVDAYKAAVDAAKQAQQEAAAAEGISVGAYNSLTAALDAQKNSTNLLKNAFDLLNGTNLTAAQAQTAMAAANLAVTTSFTQNGQAIDGNSAAAIANQQAIQAAAAAAQTNAAAIVTQTGSTDAGTRSFAASKQALEDQLAAQGNLTPAVQAYIDKLYAIPPELSTKLSVDNAAANAAIADTASRLAALSGAVASFGANHLATTGNGYVPSENGNMFVGGAQQAFADGGFPTGIYAGRPGGIHKFAEQQTGWEAYISGKPGQESRNAGIALKALGKLGYQAVSQPTQSQLPPIYVQNPFTGEYLLAQVSHVADGRIAVSAAQQGSSLSNGVRPLA